MEQEKLFEKAGAITAKAREKAVALAKPGASLEEYAEKVEAHIISLGARPAFPVNIGIDCIAAHYTPAKGDAAVFPEKGVVKIDLGAHVEGYCGDTAATVDLGGENGKLVEASQAALEAAIACAKAGAKTSDLGSAIEGQIRARGFKPIENLTGHSIKKYSLHSGKTVPNVKTRDYDVLEEGDVIAIEPFASTGRGRVSEGTQVEIFSFLGKANVRLLQARKVQDVIIKEYGALPFAERWLYSKLESRFLIQSGLKELAHSGALHAHPVLSDSPGSLVSQAEHTLIIEKGGCRVLTK